REIGELRPKKTAVDEIRQFTEQLRVQEKAFKELRRGEGARRWSKRLNRLAVLTPDGIWYTDLTLEPEKGLVIQGAAIGQGGAETVSIGRLVSDLKADPDFTVAVKDIQIESIKRVLDGQVEVVQFTLTCALHGSAS
ncbi:MAG: PilN domain-containing protein, partial [Dehalococcoidia bacterium]|nr:PilN domain-containing protein [Dehalococcoidia bacterium]